MILHGVQNCYVKNVICHQNSKIWNIVSLKFNHKTSQSFHENIFKKALALEVDHFMKKSNLITLKEVLL